MTISLCDRISDVGISCHSATNIYALSKGAGYPGRKCANQRVTAGLCIFLLGMRLRSVSVTPYGPWVVRDNWKGRAVKTALTDRRRQSCRTPSKPSWPLACSLFLLPVRSKKSPWKSPWSWKSLLWRSTDLVLLSPGQTARHQADSRHLCPQSKHYSSLAFSRWSQHVSSRKKPLWSSRLWTKYLRRNSDFVFWPGAYSVRPKLSPAAIARWKAC